MCKKQLLQQGANTLALFQWGGVIRKRGGEDEETSKQRRRRGIKTSSSLAYALATAVTGSAVSRQKAPCRMQKGELPCAFLASTLR